MYKLTLTREERKAIDWVGYRYSNGDELYSLLWGESGCEGCDVSPDICWEDEGEITFNVPEHVAWRIKDNSEAEDGFWPCFAPELAEKMQKFVDSIV